MLEMLPKSEGEQRKMRDLIASRVKGVGKKEASHFLRNAGHGSTLAILDRHVLKNLREAGVIGSASGAVTRRKYDEIEGRVEGFCRKNKIPMQHLDLLFWSAETGEIFK